MQVVNANPCIRIDRRGGLIGVGIGAAALTVCCIWYSWKIGILFAAMFLLAGFVRIRPKHPLTCFLLNALWGTLCIFVSCMLPSTMDSDASFFSIGHYRIVMNYLCVAVVYGVCLVAAGEIKCAVGIASSLLLLITTVNAFLYQFRGSELKPLDFLTIRTALNVAGQYTYRIQDRMMYSWLIWLWMMLCLRALPPSDGLMRRCWLRAAAAAATCICALMVIYGTPDVRTNTWRNGGTTENGYFLNFYTGLRDCFVEKPEGYSLEAIEELAEKNTPGEPPTGTESKPNILVIMNESFADLSVLGNELYTNQPVTPFFDSLQENTVRGYALVSVFGGGTANSEFEFLTGSSMANLPAGSVPYQQYITGDIFGLPWLMDAWGYRSAATHPFVASGWNRPAVYPHLGFTDITFTEAYVGKEVIREFVSDREMYDYVLERLEEPADQPLFLFGITMQNHGDYIYTGSHYEQTIYLEGYDREYPMAEQFLTLLHESDKALEYLLTKLKEFPEDTVVLFFGDHLPQIEGDFLRAVHGGSFDTLSDKMLQYKVPFFIWANYDIPEQTVPCTSLNYLAAHLLETAGVELPPYYRFLKEMEGTIPAINALGYYSVSEQTFLPLEDAQGEEAQWLNRYAMLQYNNLFDGKNRNQALFQQYIGNHG